LKVGARTFSTCPKLLLDLHQPQDAGGSLAALLPSTWEFLDPLPYAVFVLRKSSLRRIDGTGREAKMNWPGVSVPFTPIGANQLPSGRKNFD